MRRLYVDESLCRGCTLCELGCSFSKEGEFNPAKARLYVINDEFEGISMPLVCTQCGKCAEVCPEHAIFLDSGTSAYRVDETKCNGCGDCVKECPQQVLFLHPETGKAVICDLCKGKPKCVEACPFGAIAYLEQATITRICRKSAVDKVTSAIVKTKNERGI